MRITIFFTLFFLNVQLVHSACGGTVHYYGFNSDTQIFEDLYVGQSTADYNSYTTDYYITACAPYTQVKIAFNPNSFVLVNIGESYTMNSNCVGSPFSCTWHVISSSLQLYVPASLFLPACSNDYQISGISSSGVSGQSHYLCYFSAGNGSVNGSSQSPQPIISDVYSNSFLIVELSDSICFLRDSIEIISAISEPMDAQICMVTIDSSNSHNLITWEKNPNMGIVTYRIYKQSTLTSQYELIHEQPYASLSEFVDLNSNANQEISRYKILAADSCGYESTISPNHTTILLSSNLGASSVNLSWNPYEGFSYPNFEIWRSLNGGVSYNLLASVANNTYAYIDNNAPQQAYYQVRINNEAGCFSSKSQYNNVVSNTVDQSGNSLSLSEYSSNLPLTAYPNPTNDFFNLKSNKNLIGSKYEILDNLGRVILSSLISEENLTIDLKNASSGIYNLVIYGENVESIKLIKK
jgi:hypothetical protein